MAKAIGCLSGGLDSTLAMYLIHRQGIEVIGLNVRHLWHPLSADPAKKPPAIRAAERLGLRLSTIDGAEADLELVQHPKHGLGKRMNPCIDCRIWSLQQAKALMEAEGAQFVFTGEVLGQRPMSQHRGALDLVERESGLEDLLVRPLSAKRLPPTRPEREGIVDRERLLGIVGRSRHEQMALAAEFGITDYPSPAGGCLLTDPAFARRLRELMDHDPLTAADVELLKVGRHFRLADGTRIVVGRNEEDNGFLERLFQGGDIRLEAAAIPGPTTLVRGDANDENLRTAAALTLRYTKAARGTAQPVAVTPVGGEACTLEAVPADDGEVHRWMILPKGAGVS